MQDIARSFRNRKILTSFTIDAIAILAIIFILFLFNTILQTTIGPLAQFTDQQQIQNALLAGSSEEVQQLIDSLKSFFVVFFAGLLISLVLIVLIFSVSRAYLWSRLQGKRFILKKSWKWAGLLAIMLLFLLLYLVAFGIIKMTLGRLLLSLPSPGLFQQLLTIILLLPFLLYAFYLSHSFSRTAKVWHSVGDAFALMKEQWSGLWKLYFLTAVFLIIIGLLVSLVMSAYPFSIVPVIVNIVLALLIVSWVRVQVAGETFNHRKI